MTEIREANMSQKYSYFVKIEQVRKLSTIREVTQHQRVYYMNFYPYFSYINTLPAPSENALGSFPVTIDFP